MNSERYYYKRKEKESTDIIKNGIEEFKEELRFQFMFHQNIDRSDLVRILRKYKANISAENLIIDIKEFRKKLKKNTNQNDVRKEMYEYIDIIVTKLNRDWELKKLLTEDK